jgi:hypothetical protein
MVGFGRPSDSQWFVNNYLKLGAEPYIIAIWQTPEVLMYFVLKPFKTMSDAMNCCSSGSANDIVLDENGTVLMQHHEMPIEDIYGMIMAKTFLEQKCQ